jgi:hypothetical protein
MDAYSLNLTTGALTKNGTALANLLEVSVTLNFESAPGPIEGAPNTQVVAFVVSGRVHDVASDARILAQGPAGLLGTAVAFFAGTPSRYKFSSKPGDTLALTNVPATIAAAALAGVSADGFQP